MVSFSSGPVPYSWKSFPRVTLSLNQNPVQLWGLLASLPHSSPYSPLRCQSGEELQVLLCGASGG